MLKIFFAKFLEKSNLIKNLNQNSLKKNKLHCKIIKKDFALKNT